MSKTITISKIDWTEGARPQQVSVLEISDEPLYKGGFGRLYQCLSFNGVACTSPQLIKILIENVPGSSTQGYNTVTKLQHALPLLFKNNLGYDNLFQVPALKAFPLFSFKGELDGKTVLGYSTTDLTKQGFAAFEDFASGDDTFRQQYMSLPFQKRYRFCFHLVKGFEILDKINYVHADINPKNIFVNIASGELAIIDFDGGVVADVPGAKPLACGKLIDGEWLSPEIYEQLEKNADAVPDRYNDRWSVSVALHHLIFLEDPFCFLKEQSKKCKEDYLSNNPLYPINTEDENVSESAAYFIEFYEEAIRSHVPSVIHKELVQTFEQGFLNQHKRCTCEHWVKLFMQVQPHPRIIFFKAHKEAVIKDSQVILSWQVEGDDIYKLCINEIGDVTGKHEVTVRPEKNTIYRLDAIGHFGHAHAHVEVLVFPVTLLESLKVPFPDVSMRVSIDGIAVSSPKIPAPVRLEVEKFSQMPVSFAALHEKYRGIKPLRPDKPGFWNIMRVFNKIKKEISEN